MLSDYKCSHKGTIVLVSLDQYSRENLASNLQIFSLKFQFWRKDMQKKLRFFLVGFVCVMLAGVFLACSSGYGHRSGYGYPYGYGNNSGYQSRDAFNYGYREGYEHGVSDRRHGEDFNYSHDSKFRNGISNDRYINDQFRQGYYRGYQEGYYGNRSGYYRY
jgi:hypothetical protein